MTASGHACVQHQCGGACAEQYTNSVASRDDSPLDARPATMVPLPLTRIWSMRKCEYSGGSMAPAGAGVKSRDAHVHQILAVLYLHVTAAAAAATADVSSGVPPSNVPSGLPASQ